MLETTLLAAVGLATASFAVLRARRLYFYKDLDARARTIISSSGRLEEVRAVNRSDLPGFDSRLARLRVALDNDTFQAVRDEIVALVKTERSYLPSHKKGGTVAYETLICEAPKTVALYQSAWLSGMLSEIVGEKLQPTPLADQSSCSVLFYERAGDHIGWHYDHNFYRGRHVTVLVPVVNEGVDGAGLSSAQLQARIDGRDEVIPTPPNSLIVFEGQKVLHRVTPIKNGERRIILSMTFTTDPRNSWAQGVKRRIKDTAFFGVRALWT